MEKEDNKNNKSSDLGCLIIVAIIMIIGVISVLKDSGTVNGYGEFVFVVGSIVIGYFLGRFIANKTKLIYGVLGGIATALILLIVVITNQELHEGLDKVLGVIIIVVIGILITINVLRFLHENK
ncbi:MAG: hypothetical protein LKE30_00450 [Bacteroidales bacterium]|jgi:peptidoglycan/LPS O-acetylase OafA/YrhL|nr:hypothetical protein [Bacteroidales bacterium]